MSESADRDAPPPLAEAVGGALAIAETVLLRTRRPTDADPTEGRRGAPPRPRYDTRATNGAVNALALRSKPCTGGLSDLGRT